MAPKRNPLKLNPLQLKTLAIFQELAASEETSTLDPESGERLITAIPHPHGNHFHVGHGVVMKKDAGGLENQNVWIALERKGLARSGFPLAIRLTPEGLTYDTSVIGPVVHKSDH